VDRRNDDLSVVREVLCDLARNARFALEVEFLADARGELVEEPRAARRSPTTAECAQQQAAIARSAGNE
jgi:hypothetical protein